ncbi:hypothetical protein BAU15_13205 [Enterococcus sp. JM4C]|uniref:hypothetical protein n=1 Tax=Candidatus Enterococcus huntleyi TaxID=1857217 RepID=UPI00192A3AF4|nr:hypothetical protein [Enterococcus sp. JM4C]KAF1297717.1 hypothetical protein BAU15_13205 [Enterococcus sp. JM4C]
MENNPNIKRKHFRFPAYDDESGVKLESENRRVLFGNEEDFITAAKSGEADERGVRRSHKMTNEKQGHSIQQKEELAKHKANLPDYNKPRKTEITPTGKQKLFGEQHKHAANLTKNRTSEHRSEPMRASKKNYSGRSYFVPKYIPASIIPDEPTGTVQEDELLRSMKKSEQSFLMFDTEPAAFQERSDEDPSVKKFNKSGSPEVKINRKEYKKMDKPKGGAKKGHSILDRSLTGLIEEESTDLGKNSYFK